ncbi:MAG: hypothetical protein HN348_20800 [Proteobacteria bacterium]|nr:hypothetical protein [Pseudomonadota bacterium]
MISRQLLDLDRLYREADLAVLHGPVGAGVGFLLAGKPLLLVPLYTEQRMVARNLVGASLAIALFGEVTPNEMAHVLRILTTDSTISHAVGQFAARYSGYGPLTAAEKAAELILAAAQEKKPGQ